MKKTLSLLLFFSLSLAQAADRPKVGLVLSGGGAKGAAHVGVLKVLEEQNIPVDYVAGTSIGAYVAGMYALGYSASEIEAIMMNVDWNRGYSDTIPREALSYRDKQLRDKYNIPLNIGYADAEVKTPSGLLRGQTMSLLLRESTDVVREFASFDELAIPYRAVATDLATSQPVILSSGSVIKAMQASATVPGALQPMLIEGQLLVDGGIANNMPVDVVKAMGADIIIAVDIGSPLVGNDELNSTIAVLNQLSTMLTAASTEAQKKLLTDKDVLIRPAIDALSTTDFSIMSTALALGEQAAREQLAQLQGLGIEAQQYAEYQHSKRDRSRVWLDDMQRPVVDIVYDNHSRVSESLLEDTLGIKAGQVVKREDLEAGVNQLYALNRFERVDAEFTDTPEGRVLTVSTKAKSWGPNYFDLGFNWEDDFTADSAVTLDTAYTMTNLNDNGGEWRNELKLGYEKLLGTEFYQPLDRDQEFYGRARYQYEITAWELFDANNKVFEFDKDSHRIDLGLGLNFAQLGQLELGVTGERGKISNEALLLEDLKFSSYGGYFQIGYDSLNSISFPTSGNRVTLRVTVRKEDYHIDDYELETSTQVQADWKGALGVGNHAFVGKVSLESSDNDGESYVHLAELGGFLNLSGYRKDSLVGAHKVFGAFVYQYDLGRDALGMTDYPLYLGASLEAGNVWWEMKDVSLQDLIYAGSIYIGTDTDLGPAALGIGLTDDGQRSFYLFVGKNF
ncbi:patatin-like phospholipase family protein [Shewanella sp. FJAT-52076]|uniref:patatin-like phospholipase family protein n=1 Tax=Shewanella sp. FJAT-52076 TaxID=2864202 RepID=UPI001C65BB90|nr:patatin-like phospholipase family protein [Shewanella sp. FJAT-52076]QYJ75782.1 patatin-like phospholipase family protein [Shewanella sp. FJAT-52076]